MKSLKNYWYWLIQRILLRLSDKKRFEFAQYQLRKMPDCKNCRGRGWIVTHVRLDSITTLDKDDLCPFCDGYGKHPLNPLTEVALTTVSD